MRICLIFNPSSNQGKAGTHLPFIREHVKELPDVRVLLTQGHGHAVELAASAADDGYDRVIALGGDGTNHEVVNGLMHVPFERRPELGIVPLGSGNDFSFACGLNGTTADLLTLALQGKSHSMDIGLVEDNTGRHEYWVNSLGIGFDALINIYSRRVPLFKGSLVYLLAALRTILFSYTHFHFKAILDGKSWQDTLLMLIIANGMREGGSFMIAPQGRLDDDALAYSAVQLIKRPQMLKALVAYMKGRQNDLAFVQDGSFTTLELDSDQPLILHTDGEIYAGLDSTVKHLSIRSVPQAIRLVCQK